MKKRDKPPTENEDRYTSQMSDVVDGQYFEAVDGGVFIKKGGLIRPLLRPEENIVSKFPLDEESGIDFKIQHNFLFSAFGEAVKMNPETKVRILTEDEAKQIIFKRHNTDSKS